MEFVVLVFVRVHDGSGLARHQLSSSTWCAVPPGVVQYLPAGLSIAQITNTCAPAIF